MTTSTPWEGVDPLPPGEPKDPTLSMMQALGLPMTRSTYLEFNYPGQKFDPEEPLLPELEAEIPEQFQIKY